MPSGNATGTSTAIKVVEAERRARALAALAEPYIRHGRLLPLHLEWEMRELVMEIRAMREAP